MNTVKSVSWTRMAMAFAAVLLVGGSGLVLAATPDATYIPKSASLSSSVGTTVPKGTKSNLTLTVVFDKGNVHLPDRYARCWRNARLLRDLRHHRRQRLYGPCRRNHASEKRPHHWHVYAERRQCHLVPDGQHPLVFIEEA